MAPAMRRTPSRHASNDEAKPLAAITATTCAAWLAGGALPLVRPDAGTLALFLWAGGFAAFAAATHAWAWTRAPRSPRKAGRLAGTAYACVVLVYWLAWPATARLAQGAGTSEGSSTAATRTHILVPGLLLAVIVLGVLVAGTVPLASWLRGQDASRRPRPFLTSGALRKAVDMAEKPTIGKTKTTTSRIIMPGDTNPQGNAYGGSIVKYLDEIAAVVARRHARANVVTASIERMDFLAPVYLGDLLIFKCALIYTGRTSMIVGTRIEAEDMSTGRVVKTGSCYLTFVALDRDGNPATVDKIAPGDDPEEKRWYEKGKIIRDHSKSVTKRLKEHGSAEPVE